MSETIRIQYDGKVRDVNKNDVVVAKGIHFIDADSRLLITTNMKTSYVLSQEELEALWKLLGALLGKATP